MKPTQFITWLFSFEHETMIQIVLIGAFYSADVSKMYQKVQKCPIKEKNQNALKKIRSTIIVCPFSFCTRVHHLLINK